MAKPKTPRRGSKPILEKDMNNYLIEAVVKIGQSESISYQTADDWKQANEKALATSGSVRIFKVERRLVKVVR